MRYRTLAAICLAALAGPAFAADPARRVVDLPGGPYFEVLAMGGDAGEALYCAAGSYAYEKLRASAADRVMLIAPIGPSRTTQGRRGAVFTLTTTEAAPVTTGFGISARKTGESMTVGAAHQICNRPDRSR